MLGKHCRNIVAFAFRLEKYSKQVEHCSICILDLEKYIKHAEYHLVNDVSVIQFEICLRKMITEKIRVSLR